MHIFDNISDLHPDAYDLNPDTLRITVVNANGSVIFDSNADFSVMENHEDRPEIHMAAKVGEGSGTRRSTTLDRNLFYYAIRIDNGRILRIAREGDNIFALTQNMMMTVVGVFVLLFFFCIMMLITLRRTLWRRSSRWRRIFRSRGRRRPIRSWYRL